MLILADTYTDQPQECIKNLIEIGPWVGVSVVAQGV